MRRTVGLWLGPGLALAVLGLPFPGLAPGAHRLLAIVAWVVVYWLTEALPMSATALLGVVFAALLGLATPRLLLEAFSDPIIALIIGSFVLARAMQIHGLDRRVASACLTHSWVDGRPVRLLWAVGLAAWLLAMWMGITACVAMLFPVVLAVGRSSAPSGATEEPMRRWTTGLLLMLVYAASAGAMATPVGTPPNLIGIALIRNLLGVSIGFMDWMRIGVPLALLLLVSRYAVIVWRYAPAVSERRDFAGSLPHAGGAWTPGQRNSCAALVTAIVLWMVPGVAVLLLGSGHPAAQALQQRLSPGVAAALAVSLLLLLPAGAGRATLSWRQALQIDWGTVLLFGSGIALGRMMVETGLAQELGQRVFGGSIALHPGWLAGMTSLAALVMSELISNTAAANLVIPMVVSVASLGPYALLAAVAATLAASLGFMLPVSTPANAMIYGSGKVPLADMITTGLLVDLLGLAMVWAAVLWLAPLVWMVK